VGDTGDPLCLECREIKHANYDIFAPAARQNTANRSIVFDLVIGGEISLTALQVIFVSCQ
jgi:hypothetical protein